MLCIYRYFIHVYLQVLLTCCVFTCISYMLCICRCFIHVGYLQVLLTCRVFTGFSYMSGIYRCCLHVVYLKVFHTCHVFTGVPYMLCVYRCFIHVVYLLKRHAICVFTGKTYNLCIFIGETYKLFRHWWGMQVVYLLVRFTTFLLSNDPYREIRRKIWNVIFFQTIWSLGSKRNRTNWMHMIKRTVYWFPRWNCCFFPHTQKYLQVRWITCVFTTS